MKKATKEVYVTAYDKEFDALFDAIESELRTEVYKAIASCDITDGEAKQIVDIIWEKRVEITLALNRDRNPT